MSNTDLLQTCDSDRLLPLERRCAVWHGHDVIHIVSPDYVLLGLQSLPS